MLDPLGVPAKVRWLVYLVLLAATTVIVAASFPAPVGVDLGRIFFWAAITFALAALPVRLPGGIVAHTTTAPLIAAVFDSGLPNPFAIVWIALLGTIEIRDLRRQIPLWGTFYNRANYVLATFGAWVAVRLTQDAVRPDDPLGTVAQIGLAGLAFSFVNMILAVSLASLRTDTPFGRVWALSISNVLTGLVALVPVGWLMAQIGVKVGLWAAFLFMVPLYLARFSFSKYAETRELFFGTVSALSQAIDAKDGFTRGHADRVSRIAGAIAREMHITEKQIEQIELAGLLHDIGKIGVEDRILMKPMRLDADEQELMRRHPIYGASILEPSAALRPLVQMVLHHHENFDGSGYPEGLKGDDIPLGSRIIIVADAYEAMTSDRIYRKAIGHEKAMDQLTKYKGIQFDATVVRALEQLLQKRGPGAFEVSDLPPINYETLAELRRRLAREPIVRDAHAG
ncbi:MAG TPA: HD-GYP domain-containing protein [Candidatus Limnocylindria bacterium]|nr:HD-GYP domain-containing protein [Candidatus Limnocylindria bacterium]